VHLNPGAGNMDFASLFQRLESSGYRYYYMMDFGSLADKLVGRDRLVAC
jgi:sugar phosphate isomerase/epimerase